MISKNYLSILVEQLFLRFFHTSLAAGFSKILYLYLLDVELRVETLSEFPASFIEHLSLLKCHKLD